MRKPRIGTALLAAALLAAAAVYAVPRAADAVSGLDDPARTASRALDETFDGPAAQREIEAALAAQDIELAQSIVELAQARSVTVDPALAERVAAAAADAATMRSRAPMEPLASTAKSTSVPERASRTFSRRSVGWSASQPSPRGGRCRRWGAAARSVASSAISWARP